MRLTIPLCLILLCFSCATGHLTNDLRDREAYRLYRNSLKQENDLKIHYSPDSSYVLLMKSGDSMQGNPRSFVVIDLHQRSVIYKSINKYRDAEWNDLHTLKLKKNIGYFRPNTDPGQPGREKSYELLDIYTKEISDYTHTNSEKH